MPILASLFSTKVAFVFYNVNLLVKIKVQYDIFPGTVYLKSAIFIRTIHRYCMQFPSSVDDHNVYSCWKVFKVHVIYHADDTRNVFVSLGYFRDVAENLRFVECKLYCWVRGMR